MEIKIGIYPGAFDPLTFGHMDIIRRSLKIVDKLIIGVLKFNVDILYLRSNSCGIIFFNVKQYLDILR